MVPRGFKGVSWVLRGASEGLRDVSGGLRRRFSGSLRVPERNLMVSGVFQRDSRGSLRCLRRFQRRSRRHRERFWKLQVVQEGAIPRFLFSRDIQGYQGVLRGSRDVLMGIWEFQGILSGSRRSQ